MYCVLDGAHQRDDGLSESSEGECGTEAQVVGASEARCVQGRPGPGGLRGELSKRLPPQAAAAYRLHTDAGRHEELTARMQCYSLSFLCMYSLISSPFS